MALSGDEIILHKRHLPSLNLSHEFMNAFDRYREGALMLQRTIGELQQQALSHDEAERKLFQIFYRRILPARLLPPVADAYFHHHGPTAWGLLNACTLHAKCLAPASNMKAHARLGTYFGLGGHEHGA